MFVSLFSKFLASLLVASVCGVIITTVFNQTVFNAHYIEGQLTKVDGYNRLTEAVCDEAIQQSNLVSESQIASPLCKMLLVSTLTQKVNGVLNQLQLYYQGKAPAPSLDLSGLVSQAQSAGLQLSPNSTLLNPIKIVPDSGTNKTIAYPTKTFAGVRTTTVVTSLVLILALLAISLIYHRYRILPNVLISVGVFIGLTALVFYLGSSLLSHYIHTLTAPNMFISVVSDLVHNISHDLAYRFGVIAAVCLIVGITARIIIRYVTAQPKLVEPVASTDRASGELR
ncbi:MAG TPA: hypothetical protein VMB52_02195 [Verrucomicrobiae bacterium]|nr:hypothetical protein [Verrucomicrobiae bacterium]